MKINLPCNIVVDLDDIPDNLEQIVQEAFAEFTGGTNPEYMHHDKLYFIDLMTERLHCGDAHDNVRELIKRRFEFQLDEYDIFTDAEEFLNIEFMEECYELGERNRWLYSKEFSKDRHANEKIMQIECRVIKAVMDYES